MSHLTVKWQVGPYWTRNNTYPNTPQALVDMSYWAGYGGHPGFILLYSAAAMMLPPGLCHALLDCDGQHRRLVARSKLL